MKYEGKLPSTRLDANDLKELEKILLNSFLKKKKFEQKIEIKYDGWSKSYQSVSELVEDPAKPNEVRDINWSLRCSEGTVWIYSCDNFPTNLMIEGKDKWVKNLQRDLYEFIKKYKSLTGTIANNFGFIIFSMIVGEIFIISGILEITKLKILPGLFSILIGCIPLIFSIVQEHFKKRAIPYFRIEFKENINRKRLEQIIIGIITSIIFSILVYLVRYIFLK
jgi:hypothetical protein